MKLTSPLLTGALAAALLLGACVPVDLPGGGPAGPAPTSSPEPAHQTAQDAARAMLAEKLGIPVADIVVVSATPTEFSDSCLGIAIPEAMCAAVITPGFRVTLSANDLAYVYHTNQDASAVLENQARIIWGRTGGIAGVCQALEIVRDGEAAAGPCGSVAPIELTEAEREQLAQWLTTFGEFRVTTAELNGDVVVADGFEDDLFVVGTGTAEPTLADKQALLDWAASVYGRVTSGS